MEEERLCLVEEWNHDRVDKAGSYYKVDWRKERHRRWFRRRRSGPEKDETWLLSVVQIGRHVAECIVSRD